VENLCEFFRSRVPEFLHVVFDLTVNKITTLHFFTGLLDLHFREITYAKKLSFPTGIFSRSFVTGKTKETFCFPEQ